MKALIYIHQTSSSHALQARQTKSEEELMQICQLLQLVVCLLLRSVRQLHRFVPLISSHALGVSHGQQNIPIYLCKDYNGDFETVKNLSGSSHDGTLCLTTVRSE